MSDYLQRINNPNPKRFPSALSLVDALYNLARSIARAVFGLSTWDTVDYWVDTIQEWFHDLIDAIKDRARWYAVNFVNWVVDGVNGLANWISQAAVVANYARNWVVDTGETLYNWYDGVWRKVDYFVDHVYTWLVDFWEHPGLRIAAYLGQAWTWLRSFYYNPWRYIKPLLGDTWPWLVWLWTYPSAAIPYYLGEAWTWLHKLFQAPYATLTGILGTTWSWLVTFKNGPITVLNSLLGGALDFLRSLFKLNPDGLLSFIRWSLTYYYNLWSNYRAILAAFLADPVGFMLDLLVDVFLGWLEKLIADNW